MTDAQLAGAAASFKPLRRGERLALSGETPRSRVRITNANGPVDLVATFLPGSTLPNGSMRVAGTQTVDTQVEIDLSECLPVCWMASAQEADSIGPNQAAFPYSGPNDSFTLTPVPGLSIWCTAGRWSIPAFDQHRYKVRIGFGLGTTWIAWGYSVECAPGTTIVLEAGGYALCRSDGDEQIGDPVPSGCETWPMSLGETYLLAFDASGNGTLTQE